MKFDVICLVVCAFAMCTFAIPPWELLALENFYNSTGGANWTNNAGWLQPDTDPCKDWFGIQCTDDGANVQAISLSNNNLVGNFPENLPALQNLISIDVGLNRLSGKIPPSFWHITKMYAISLKENQLSGDIDFSFMPNMQFAHMDFNQLTGNLNGFCNCPNLKVLGLTNNNINGSIPDCFASFTQLQTLQLGGNQLSGPIPAFSAESLRSLDLSRNHFTGAPAIPKLIMAKGLTEMELFGNKLSGSISGLSNHPSMVIFDFHENAMTGSIPADYATSMPNLMILRGQKNSLTGFLPNTFTNSTIVSFDFTDNNLYCPLPPLPPGGAATCGSWTLSLANPSRCTVGEKCFIVVTGSGFTVGEDAYCVFGDATTVPANVVSTSELRCIVTPSIAASMDLFIAMNGRQISSNTLPFEFVDKNNNYNKVPAKRSANANAVKVRIHGESKCPDFGSIVTIFKDIVDKLGTDVLDLDLGFIMKSIPVYPTGFWSLHGQSEVVGNAMIACIEKQYDVATAVKFAACLAETIDTVPTNAAACADKLGLDFSNIPMCALSDTGKQLLTKAMEAADNDHAVWSPTVVINDETYCLWHSTPCKATKDTDFLRAICDAYQGPTPEACK